MVFNPFLHSISLSLLTVVLFLIYRNFKIKKITHAALIENCLMTKVPLMILTSPESLFKIRNSFRCFYILFQQHGYETYWTKTAPQEKNILHLLQSWDSKNQKFHLFLDTCTLQEVNQILTKKNFSCIESINLLKYNEPKKAIEKVVELAESEFCKSF